MNEETRIYTLELTQHEAARLAGSAVQQGQQETDLRYWTPDPELREHRRARWEVLTAALRAEGWAPPPDLHNHVCESCGAILACSDGAHNAFDADTYPCPRCKGTNWRDEATA